MDYDQFIRRVRNAVLAEEKAWQACGSASYALKGQECVGKLFDAACGATDRLLEFMASTVKRDDDDPTKVAVPNGWVDRWQLLDKPV